MTPAGHGGVCGNLEPIGRATKKAARALGYAHIHAIIRADNAGGLAYYQSRGFEDFRLLPDCPLGDGRVVDKLWKRFEL